MSIEWKHRIQELLEADVKKSKTKYLRSVLSQGDRYDWACIPTANQLRILLPMWRKHEERRIADVIGC